ncbi:hypothetical protein VTN02DRAFT_754 [Thermoascus thermophilus]
MIPHMMASPVRLLHGPEKLAGWYEAVPDEEPSFLERLSRREHPSGLSAPARGTGGLRDDGTCCRGSPPSSRMLQKAGRTYERTRSQVCASYWHFHRVHCSNRASEVGNESQLDRIDRGIIVPSYQNRTIRVYLRQPSPKEDGPCSYVLHFVPLELPSKEYDVVRRVKITTRQPPGERCIHSGGGGSVSWVRRTRLVGIFAVIFLRTEREALGAQTVDASQG